MPAETLPVNYISDLIQGDYGEVHTPVYTFKIHRGTSTLDTGEVKEAVALQICLNGTDKPREEYIMDEGGVFKMSFEFPPLTNVSPADVDFPAYLPEHEKRKLAKKRAEEVASFVKAALETKPD